MFIEEPILVAICLFMAGMGGIVGVVLEKVWSAPKFEELEAATQEQQAALAEAKETLRGAQVDSQIVQALRDGVLGVGDLQEIGFEDIRQEAIGALKEVVEFPAPKKALEAAPSGTSEEYMEFVKLPYDRNCKAIQKMVPGDEVWIALTDLLHRPSGTPCLWNIAQCSSAPSSFRRHRVRFYNGRFELAVDPTSGQLASGFTTESSEAVDIDHVTILRPEHRWG